MGLFNKKRKYPEETEEPKEDEPEEEDEDEEAKPLLLCPFCEKEIDGLIYKEIDDDGGSECGMWGCSKCRKVVGFHY